MTVSIVQSFFNKDDETSDNKLLLMILTLNNPKSNVLHSRQGYTQRFSQALYLQLCFVLSAVVYSLMDTAMCTYGMLWNYDKRHY